MTTDNVILLGLIEEYGEFRLVEEPFTDEPYGVGVQQSDDNTFVCWVNERLQEIYDSGEWEQAYEETVGQVAETTPEPPEIDFDRYDCESGGGGGDATPDAGAASPSPVETPAAGEETESPAPAE